MANNNFKYGKPVAPEEMPKPRKRMPQYDECLKEFLTSNSNYWEINMNTLPSQNEKIVLSSLKWRIKNNSEFRNIRVVMHDKKIFLEKVKIG